MLLENFEKNPLFVAIESNGGKRRAERRWRKTCRDHRVANGMLLVWGFKLMEEKETRWSAVDPWFQMLHQQCFFGFFCGFACLRTHTVRSVLCWGPTVNFYKCLCSPLNQFCVLEMLWTFDPDLLEQNLSPCRGSRLVFAPIRWCLRRTVFSLATTTNTDTNVSVITCVFLHRPRNHKNRD